jgi:hypothetical protein
MIEQKRRARLPDAPGRRSFVCDLKHKVASMERLGGSKRLRREASLSVFA